MAKGFLLYMVKTKSWISPRPICGADGHLFPYSVKT